MLVLGVLGVVLTAGLHLLIVWAVSYAKSQPKDAPPAVNYTPFPARFVPPYHYAATPLAPVRSRAPVKPVQRPDDALGRLEATADARELALGRAHSVRAIENLQAMYGYYIDQGQWSQAARLFAVGPSLGADMEHIHAWQTILLHATQACRDFEGATDFVIIALEMLGTPLLQFDDLSLGQSHHACQLIGRDTKTAS